MTELRGSPPGAAIVTVGDELQYGQTVDGNAAWLADRLTLAGFGVRVRIGVGDDPEAIAAALADAIVRAEVVLVTGGLGPTRDDRTREAVARALDRRLLHDPEIERSLRARFERRGLGSFPGSNLRQAQVPEGASLLPNRRGTAPGLHLREGPTHILLLPGVPAEMKGLYEEQVAPLLEERFGDRVEGVSHRTLRTTGIPESALADRLEAIEDALAPVGLAYLPDVDGVELRLTARGPDPIARAALLEDAVRRLTPHLDSFRIEEEGRSLAEAVGDRLIALRLTLSIAESCTAGWVCKRMTDRPGSSEYFMGGIVAYENRIKSEQLGIDSECIETHGAVSREVAEAMASGVAERMKTDVGISVTGIAGPDGGSEKKPVGTVWYAVSVGGALRSEVQRFPGDRDQVRVRSSQAVLHLLYRELGSRMDADD